MITGSIKTHKEPQKYRNHSSTSSSDSGWNWMYEQKYEDYSMTGWKLKDEALLKELNAGTLKGLVMGARVQRTSGTPGLGTITHIHRTFTMAFNESTKEIEPFKVVWDKTTPMGGGSFDYCADDIKVADELPPGKRLPALFELKKDQYTNETNLHLC